MRRVRRIPHQHNRYTLSTGKRLPMHPCFAHHTREANPDRRAAQMPGVRDQAMAVEIFREELLAKRDALFLRHRVDAMRFPDFLGRFDDKG